MPSLKSFREQAKIAPIYMQEKKSENSFDFDDLNEEPNSDQIPPVPYDDTDEVREEPSDVEETTSPQKGRKATHANKQRAITSRRKLVRLRGIQLKHLNLFLKTGLKRSPGL